MLELICSTSSHHTPLSCSCLSTQVLSEGSGRTRLRPSGRVGLRAAGRPRLGSRSIQNIRVGKVPEPNYGLYPLFQIWEQIAQIWDDLLWWLSEVGQSRVSRSPAWAEFYFFLTSSIKCAGVKLIWGGSYKQSIRLGATCLPGLPAHPLLNMCLLVASSVKWT